MMISGQVRCAKCRHEILDEFVLRLLLQCHAQQLEFRRRFALANIVEEAKITRETQVEVPNRELE
jgi:hypothetical protein